MSALLDAFVMDHGSTIVVAVIIALAVWMLRAVIIGVLRALLWVVKSIVFTTVNEIKWRVGWY